MCKEVILDRVYCVVYYKRQIIKNTFFGEFTINSIRGNFMFYASVMTARRRCGLDFIVESKSVVYCVRI